jgi:hypothetical protein
MRSVIHHPDTYSVGFGVVCGLLLFLTPGAARMDALSISSAVIFGGLCGIGARIAISRLPPAH